MISKMMVDILSLHPRLSDSENRTGSVTASHNCCTVVCAIILPFQGRGLDIEDGSADFEA